MSEEASSYGRELDTRFSQQSPHCLERRRGVLLALLLELELTQLYSLGPTAVSLPGGRGGGTEAKSELILTQWIIKYRLCLKEPVADSTKFNRN